MKKTQIETLTFNGSYRVTESANLENFSQEFTTNKSLNEVVVLETGYIYDMGMSMVIDANHSDELFIADGAWGYDDLNENSIVNSFTVSQQDYIFEDNSFGIERGIEVNASVKDYQNIFRSITPKWNFIDLSAFSNLSFSAKGTGLVKITVVNPEETVWENQINYDLTLTENLTDYTIDFYSFNNYTTPSDLAAVNMIVISIIGDNETFSDKELMIKDINFNNNMVSTANNTVFAIDSKMYPNPTTDFININISSDTFDAQQVSIYNTNGVLVYNAKLSSLNTGIQVDLSELITGLYIVKIQAKNGKELVETIMKN